MLDRDCLEIVPSVPYVGAGVTRDAAVKKFVPRLPLGFNSPLEGGNRISPG